MNWTRGLIIAGLAIIATSMVGCGYSEDEWQAQLAKYSKLSGELGTTQKELADTKAQLKSVNEALEAEKLRVASLEKDLEDAGFNLEQLRGDLAQQGQNVNDLKGVLAEREKALAEYKKRAAQLEAIKRRFEKLRNKLNELTNLGLAVTVRNNRMIISLPGDVMFQSGQERLRKSGQKVLDKVGEIINGDAGLRARQYQVAGHTDNVEMRGPPFGDNWGLSLMRARRVLLYLIDPKHGKLPRDKWSAAGFADTDPVSTNDTREGKQKNRRCEIIVVPNAEEMLDLRSLL